MANEMQHCPIWGMPVEQTISYPDQGNILAVHGTPRTDGNYHITPQARSYVSALDDSQRARLTTMIIEERRKTGQTPVVTPKLIEDAKRADPLPHHMRAERLLRYLANKPQRVGQEFSIPVIASDMKALAWSESTEGSEIEFFVGYLTTMGWLHSRRGGCTITVQGFEHVAEQATKRDLSQCFVAMWFEPSMNQAYEDGIKKAVEECGYKPLRIDQKLDVNKIDDEIIAEIRRSRFVVADFTHDTQKGVRGGVYYEAGFASGLGLEVIFSCRKGLEEELHFDTRQYHHILWETPDDLCKQLRDRIRARVGDQKAWPIHTMRP